MSCAFINIRLAMASTITCALALFIPFTGHAQSPAKLDKVVIAGWGKPITEITNLLVEEDKGFFKAKGIEMGFIPGAGGADAIRNLLTGQADVAFTYMLALVKLSNACVLVIAVFGTVGIVAPDNAVPLIYLRLDMYPLSTFVLVA
jgi:ABC-type nitrate/sulfonate/bicarbonate transport system substrate-binding protein